MSTSKPWYTYDSYSKDAAAAIARSINACAKLRRHDLRAGASMSYLYHRERVMVQLAPRMARGGAAPGFVTTHMPWLNGNLGSLMVDPTVNIVKSAVDSVSSSMFVENPLIEIRPMGADFEQLLEWEHRELALNSTINRREARYTQRRIGRDGLVVGAGHVIPVYQNGDISYQRLRNEQVLYDPNDAEFDLPTFVHRVDLVDRREFVAFLERIRVPRGGADDDNGSDAAIALPTLGAHVAAVNAAPRKSELLPGYEDEYRPLHRWLYDDEHTDDTDRIRVAYSWRRASRVGADDGRHTITLLDGTEPRVVFDCVFSRTTLPIVSWSPFPSDGGAGGSGLVALLMGWQAFIDRTINKIVTNQDRFGYIKLLVHKNEFRNEEVGGLLKHGVLVVPVGNPGTKPQWVHPPVLRGEDIQVLELAMDLSRSEYGINRMLTQGTSQLRGQVSGIAMVEEDAKTRDRLSDIRENWADFRVRLANETLSAIEDATAYDPEFAAHYRTPDGRQMTRKWSELSEVNGRYVLEPEEVGVLGATRAGRSAKLLDLAAKGAVPEALANTELMRSPDLLKISRIQTAGMRLAERHMRDLISTPSNPPVPSKDLDLPVTLDVVVGTLRHAMSNGAKMETLQALRDYRSGVEMLLRDAAPQPAAPPAPEAMPSMPEM